MQRNLYQELKDYDYNLYLETINKANLLIEHIQQELYKGKAFSTIAVVIEKFLIERTLYLKNKL